MCLFNTVRESFLADQRLPVCFGVLFRQFKRRVLLLMKSVTRPDVSRGFDLGPAIVKMIESGQYYLKDELGC